MAFTYLTDLNLNGNELQNAVIGVLPSDPDTANLEAGLIWFNSDDHYLKYYNGTTTIPIGYLAFETDATNIKVAGTASVGTLSTIPRADHVHPAQTSVSGNAGTASALQTARYIDGLYFKGNADAVHYATCDTAEAATAKVATVINSQSYKLQTGSIVYVKFTNASGSSAQTLNVNSTGAKSITANYSTGSNTRIGRWGAGEVVGFVYDGTYWCMISKLDTTYSAGTDALLTAGTDTSNRVWQAKILHDYIATVVGGVDAMRFKGTIGTGGDITELPTTNVRVGDTYRVITAGTYAGHVCEVGDLIIATATTPTWTVAQTNIEGAITTSDAADTNPIMDGTVAIGTSTKYARMDHVHPSDTSRVPTTRKVNGHALSADVTVTNLDLGQGYATCAIPSPAITGDTLSVTKSGYLLTVGGIVSIRFTGADLPLQSKLNINGKGAKPIYYNGQAISVADKVKENDTATFIYDGTAYHLIAIDKANRNQKMFETIKVGSTNITPESAIDTLEIVAGNGITLTPDATNDKITIASNNTNYTETNPALTATGGLCTWTITHNLGTQYNNVQIYRVSDGAQVMADIVATSTTVTTIKMISSANISAGTYRVVILGAA